MKLILLLITILSAYTLYAAGPIRTLSLNEVQWLYKNSQVAISNSQNPILVPVRTLPVHMSLNLITKRNTHAVSIKASNAEAITILSGEQCDVNSMCDFSFKVNEQYLKKGDPLYIVAQADDGTPLSNNYLFLKPYQMPHPHLNIYFLLDSSESTTEIYFADMKKMVNHILTSLVETGLASPSDSSYINVRVVKFNDKMPANNKLYDLDVYSLAYIQSIINSKSFFSSALFRETSSDDPFTYEWFDLQEYENNQDNESSFSPGLSEISSAIMLALQSINRHTLYPDTSNFFVVLTDGDETSGGDANALSETGYVQKAFSQMKNYFGENKSYIYYTKGLNGDDKYGNTNYCKHCFDYALDISHDQNYAQVNLKQVYDDVVERWMQFP